MKYITLTSMVQQKHVSHMCNFKLSWRYNIKSKKIKVKLIIMIYFMLPNIFKVLLFKYITITKIINETL